MIDIILTGDIKAKAAASDSDDLAQRTVIVIVHAGSGLLDAVHADDFLDMGTDGIQDNAGGGGFTGGFAAVYNELRIDGLVGRIDNGSVFNSAVRRSLVIAVEADRNA